MDSKVVTREIRREIWPVLKQSNFDLFTGRTAWRHRGFRIDVVNFQSFNSYLASGVGCTPHSFSLNLGCLFLAVPNDRVAHSKNSVLHPKEYECHFRRRLSKSIAQVELARTDTWLIRDDGYYLPEAIDDAKEALVREGLPWFDRFHNEKEVFRTLIEDDEDVTWGFGAKDAPMRHYLTGYVALALGEKKVATVHLQRALDSGCFKSSEGALLNTLRNLRSDLPY